MLVNLVKVQWVWANMHWFPFYLYLDLIQSELTFKNQEMFKGYVDIFCNRSFMYKDYSDLSQTEPGEPWTRPPSCTTPRQLTMHEYKDL